jgi:hypothetical protein
MGKMEHIQNNGRASVRRQAVSRGSAATDRFDANWSLTEREEALAALTSMLEQATQRLLEAGQEFQDLAYEMEWRVGECLGFITSREKIQRQIGALSRVNLRFNLRARKIEDRKDRADIVVELLQQRLETIVGKIERSSLVIADRNKDGEVLLEEILLLELKAERLARGVQQLKLSMPQQPRRRGGKDSAHDLRAEVLRAARKRNQDKLVLAATVEQMRHASGFDLPDLSVMVAAAEIIQRKMSELTAQ